MCVFVLLLLFGFLCALISITRFSSHHVCCALTISDPRQSHIMSTRICTLQRFLLPCNITNSMCLWRATIQYTVFFVNCWLLLQHTAVYTSMHSAKSVGKKTPSTPAMRALLLNTQVWLDMSTHTTSAVP